MSTNDAKSSYTTCKPQKFSPAALALKAGRAKFRSMLFHIPIKMVTNCDNKGLKANSLLVKRLWKCVKNLCQNNFLIKKSQKFCLRSQTNCTNDSHLASQPRKKSVCRLERARCEARMRGKSESTWGGGSYFTLVKF